MKSLLLVLVVLLASYVGATQFSSVHTIKEEQVKARSTEPLATTEELIEENNTVKVHTLDLSSANIITLYGEIGPESTQGVLTQLANFNKDNDKPIYLLLNSPGGSVLDGAHIMTAIQNSKNPVYAVNMDMCASMCFMILEHASVRMALDRTILMAHPASLTLMYQGEIDKVVSRMTFLKRFVDKMDHYIAKRSGSTYEQFKLKSSKELWLDSEDALKSNLLDQIVEVRLPKTSSLSFGTNSLRQEIKLEE